MALTWACTGGSFPSKYFSNNLVNTKNRSFCFLNISRSMAARSRTAPAVPAVADDDADGGME